MISRSQNKKDIAEAIEARRNAANLLIGSVPHIMSAIKVLAYNKSEGERYELQRILEDLKQIVSNLTDKDNDPN